MRNYWNSLLFIRAERGRRVEAKDIWYVGMVKCGARETCRLCKDDYPRIKRLNLTNTKYPQIYLKQPTHCSSSNLLSLLNHLSPSIYPLYQHPTCHPHPHSQQIPIIPVFQPINYQPHHKQRYPLTLPRPHLAYYSPPCAGGGRAASLNFNSNNSRPSMRNRNNGRDSNGAISSFIDSLLSPPLRRSNSEKTANDSLVVIRETPTNNEPKSPTIRLTPMKEKAKSEDKASQLYLNSKSYGDPSVDNSMLISRISEVTETPLHIKQQPKEVRFRQNLVKRNNHHRREGTKRDSRTPSILKRSQTVRYNSYQFMQSTFGASQLGKQPSTLVDDKQGRAAKTNEVVKKRYQTILERFDSKFAGRMKKGYKLRNDDKYKDELFPPILSSIYRGGNNKNQQDRLEDIRWVRITEQFKDHRLAVLREEGLSNLNVVCGAAKNSQLFMADAMNCLRDCRAVLEKIFESKEINDYGVYLIKIYQENVWKYVIIDDFIPVIDDGQGSLTPLYLNLTELQPGKAQCLEIWPLLVEKAYANYYSNYESLHFGNTLDFLEELSGSSAELFAIANNERKTAENMRRINRFMEKDNIMVLGYNEVSSSFTPVLRNVHKEWMADLIDGKRRSIRGENAFDNFDGLHIFNPSKWFFSSVCSVGINVKKTQEVPRFDISVRTIKLSQSGDLAISIRQKEKRFYQNSSLNYNYIWIRCLLLQKEFDGDCRWIDAKYSNQKTINFFNVLQSGEYYMVLMPEWKSSHCYELSMIVNSTVPTVISKKDYDQKEALVEKGCSDLAQRYGKLHQINPFACSYSFIHEDIGILIENINNQRYNGDIRINRSISGLKAAVDLIPFNIDFYQQKNPKLPFKTQISVYISTDKSYTVILMMRGGIDLPFLKRFDFGK